MLAAREWREDGDAAGRDVDGAELQRREGHRREVRLRAAVGGERDRAPVRRPVGLDVGVAIIRELANAARSTVDEIQIAQSARLAGEGDGLAVGRPRDIRNGPDVRHAEPLLDVRGGDVENRDLVITLGLRDEGELVAARRPGAGRRDEGDGVEVRVNQAL